MAVAAFGFKILQVRLINNLSYINKLTSIMRKLKEIIKDSAPYSLYQGQRSVVKWIIKGRPVSPVPNAYKQKIVKKFAKKFNMETFVETGTHRGAMVWAVRNKFDKIYSIELDQSLFEKASQKFSKYKHVEIIHGDSGKEIIKVLNKINDPCLFWLDGHFSEGITARGEKDTPIEEELSHIYSHNLKNHVILIDDARLFDGQNDYPAINKVKDACAKNLVNSQFEVENDLIRIFPN